MKKEIKFDDETIVYMREPRVKDMLAIQHIEGEQTKEVQLIGNLTGLVFEKIENLNLKDYGKLSKVLQSFL